MLTLSLLRHAKSSWDLPGLGDYARPLAKRGLEAAPRMGAYMAREGIRPDLVLCSGAKRTRETLDLVLPQLGSPPPAVAYEDTLYHALPGAMVERLHQAERRPAARKCRHIMIVGHNPGLHALALSLAGGGEGRDLSALAAKFPTGALAVLTFEAESWREVKPSGGRLQRFITPRTLP